MDIFDLFNCPNNIEMEDIASLESVLGDNVICIAFEESMQQLLKMTENVCEIELSVPLDSFLEYQFIGQ